MLTRALAQNLAVIGMLATLQEVKRIAMYEYEGKHVLNGNWWQLHDISMMLLTGRWTRREYRSV